jgi:hypothetical protein
MLMAASHTAWESGPMPCSFGGIISTIAAGPFCASSWGITRIFQDKAVGVQRVAWRAYRQAGNVGASRRERGALCRVRLYSSAGWCTLLCFATRFRVRGRACEVQRLELSDRGAGFSFLFDARFARKMVAKGRTTRRESSVLFPYSW